MHGNTSIEDRSLPLAGCRVVERSSTVAAAYAGRLLATLGADVAMLEPQGGSPLREAPPDLGNGGGSALFAYLSSGKHSLVHAPDDTTDNVLAIALAGADIFIDDTPIAEREAMGVDEASIAGRFPSLIHVSVLPFGASGPKSTWRGEEINLVHASGEGFLLPNGLSNELFPDRAPLKIYGHFAGYQAGCVAALSALSAWWAKPDHGGQYVDVSVQDAMLLCGAFALQRLGDGSLEHRASRSFRYGGVFQARDGYIELLTLEERQWKGLAQLLGHPEWTRDKSLDDSLERSRRGAEINRHIREWMATRDVDSIVRSAQELGVPAAKYRTPEEVVHGVHEQSRGLFAPLLLQNGQPSTVLVAPYCFHRTPLQQSGKVPALDKSGQSMPQESRC